MWIELCPLTFRHNDQHYVVPNRSPQNNQTTGTLLPKIPRCFQMLQRNGENRSLNYCVDTWHLRQVVISRPIWVFLHQPSPSLQSPRGATMHFIGNNLYYILGESRSRQTFLSCLEKIQAHRDVTGDDDVKKVWGKLHQRAQLFICTHYLVLEVV